jgi:hypothetical protein
VLNPSSAAESEIYRILCAYCEGIDTGDFDAVARIWEHGQWVFADDPGPEPVLRWLEDNLIVYDGIPRTKHHLSNVVIDVDDAPGTAFVKCYVTVHQAAPDFPLQAIFAGRITGVFERLDGRWWWKSQEVLPDLVGVRAGMSAAPSTSSQGSPDRR